MIPPSKEMAEKMFGRKASPDASLSSKEFLNKKVVQPVVNYGKNVAGGAKIVGGAVKSGISKVGTILADDLFGSEEVSKKNKAKGIELNTAYSGRRRSSSTGSIGR